MLVAGLETPPLALAAGLAGMERPVLAAGFMLENNAPRSNEGTAPFEHRTSNVYGDWLANGVRVRHFSPHFTHTLH